MLVYIQMRKYYLLLVFIMILVLAIIQVYVTAKINVEQEAVTTVSWSVANKVIVIDPGHGGGDPGKVTAKGTKEKNINLDISKKLALLLRQAGAEVILTRVSDRRLCRAETKGCSAKRREDLSKRIKMANDAQADLYISIHCNSYPHIGEHGAQVFYQPGSEQGKLLAQAVQHELVRILSNTNRQAKAMDYFVIRNTKMTAVLIETGFISNPEEESLLLDTAYQAKVARSIYAGIIKYYGYVD